MNICIIKAGESDFSGSFIKSHEELITGNKFILHKSYPNYAYKNRQIRYFYSLKGWRKKTLKLLPQFLYNRFVTKWEETDEGIHDYIGGFLRYHKIDVILAEFGENGANIAQHAVKLKIPFLVHFHGHDAHRAPFLSVYSEKYRFMFQNASNIFSVSKFMTQELLKLGANKDKIIYNPYGPRPKFFDVKPKYNNTILVVGRFSDIKAPTILALVFNELIKVNPTLKINWVGTGPLLEAAKAMVKTFGIEKNVSMVGGVDHDFIHTYFEDAFCFVQHSVIPSYGDAEGTPNTILEAGASGLPVISTRHAGIVDAVIEGKTGYLVDEYDYKSMAQKILGLVENKELITQLGENARNHITENYNISNHIERIEKALLEAVNKK